MKHFLRREMKFKIKTEKTQPVECYEGRAFNTPFVLEHGLHDFFEMKTERHGLLCFIFYILDQT